MTEFDLTGWLLSDALANLHDRGITPEVVFSVAPVKSYEQAGRTPRVVRFCNGQLLVSWFKDGLPEAVNED